MTITAVILAGGLGTRLRTVVPDLPKPMAPIGNRPFLEYLLDYWLNQGVERFIISVGYKHETIINYFGYQYKNASIDYAIEYTPMGTGGGLLLAARKINPGTSFLVLNGDTYFAVNLKELIRFAEINESDWCFSLFTAQSTDRYMGMDVSPEGRINSLVPNKDQGLCLANGGVYWVRHQALTDYPLIQNEIISLENDIFPNALLANKRFFGYACQNTFIDIGIPDDYQRSESVITNKELA